MRLKALRAFAVFCLIVFIESCGSEKHTIVGKVSPHSESASGALQRLLVNGSTRHCPVWTRHDYGLTTSTQTLLPGKYVNLLVAGMRAGTTYHMRAVARFADGTEIIDSDHSFTTGAGDTSQQATTVNATTSQGKIPQGGVELLALASATARPTVTDLSGNILWSYSAVPSGTVPNPVKLLSNGHFLINFSAGTIDGLNSVIQEVDLSGA